VGEWPMMAQDPILPQRRAEGATTFRTDRMRTRMFGGVGGVQNGSFATRIPICWRGAVARARWYLPGPSFTRPLGWERV
jgi:hypothetical protein